MYAARSKITELEGNFAELTGKVEDMQAAKEHVEIELAEAKAQVVSKDKDLMARMLRLPS
ncbi:hypothetical protein Hanom_Chr11g01039881 [Helianthus anomalus]